VKDPMSSPKTTITRGDARKAKGRLSATRQRTREPSIPQQILEGLREMSEFATSGEPPETRYTVRQLALDLEPGDYTPDKFRATREVFGLSQPLFAKFLGVEVSALRHWEQGIRSPSAVVRRFLDEMNATPDHWRPKIETAVRRTQKGSNGKRSWPHTAPVAELPSRSDDRGAAQRFSHSRQSLKPRSDSRNSTATGCWGLIS
jgi:DNA-binding transcriptional regulator YiaG